ncbi:MAG TPA: hypothetical protein VG900_07085 [Hyphomicrobiaceae bacterium]|jgi:hypothetical protein|nr:hypothetical protein [Hyphomicrobiaceae bacterium]
MYARITAFKVDPARVPELAASVEKMAPAARGLRGVMDIYVSWRGDGQGMVVAVYASKADADAAVGRIQALWGHLIALLDGAPRTDTFENVAHIAG